jgi:hypothetical protein
MTPIDQNTTSCTITIRYSTSSVAWGFNDSQNLRAYGSIDTNWNFHMGTASGSSQNVVVADAAVTVPVNYGAPGQYGFGAIISGQYLGGTPSHVIYVDVPARPPSVPGAPGISIGTVTQTTAVVWVSAPGNNGGAGIDAYTTEVWVNGGGQVQSWAGGTGTATGLTPGVNYVARAAAHNAAGWGPYSAWAPFTTIAGGRVKVGASWQNGAAWIKNPAGTWVRAVGVWKKAGATWVK